MATTFSQRLKDLREKHNLSYQQLADQIGVTKQSIYKFEKGEANPRSDTVLKLAEFFRRPYSYFYETELSLNFQNVKFRDGHKLFDQAGLEQEIREQIISSLEKLFQLENLLQVKHVFENPLKEMEIVCEKDIEKAAKIIRKKWKLGSVPILDVVDTLEHQGVVVIEVERLENFEGLSSMVNEEIPVVVLNERINIERKRFTALHELGHLVLDFADHLTDEEVENMCHFFAGAVLVVDEALYAELGKSRTVISLTELKRIKASYGISIQAIIVRAKNSGFIDHHTFKEWWRNYHEWCKNGENGMVEMGRYNSEEKPSRFQKLVVQGVNERKISWSKAAELSDRRIDALKKELTQLNFSVRN